MASNKKNLASGKLVGSISASTTSLVVNVGSGTNPEIVGVWPDAPFYITAMPSSPSAGVPNSLDSEIMSVSAVGTDGNGNTTLTVSRAQNGTTAKAFSDGSIITSAVYSDDAVFWEEGASSETPSPWIDTDDIMDNAITSDKIDCSVLWSGSDNATLSSLDLSDSVNNYKYIEIYFHDDQQFKSCLKVYNNGASASGCIFINKTGSAGDVVYITSRRFTLSGQSFSKGFETATTITGSTVSVASQTNYLRIDRIIGYKT